MGTIISKVKEECNYLNFLKRTPSHDNFLNNLNQVFLEEKQETVTTTNVIKK